MYIWTQTWSYHLLSCNPFKQKKRQYKKVSLFLVFFPSLPNSLVFECGGCLKCTLIFKPEHKELKKLKSRWKMNSWCWCGMNVPCDITIKTRFPPELCSKDKWQTFQIPGCFSWQTGQAQYCLKKKPTQDLYRESGTGKTSDLKMVK